MKRKKSRCLLVVLRLGVLTHLWWATAGDGHFLPGDVGGTSTEGGDLLVEEILQHLSDGYVPYRTMVGSKIGQPIRQTKSGATVNTGPLTADKGDRQYTPPTAGDYGPSHIDLGENANTEGNVNESPFEIQFEEAMDPYDIVNIDRGLPEQSSFLSTIKSTVEANTSPSPAAVSSAAPKRKGEMEYDTFVNVPAMRTKDLQGPVSQPKPVALHASTKRLAGSEMGDTVFYAIAAVCAIAAVLGLIFAAVSYTRLRRQYKESQFNEYPSFGLPGTKKSRSPDSVAAMDSKLASAAQLYHFQHTKQQIISMEHPSCDAKEPISDDSEAEEDDGDYSVYECPGLAPTGDMEINNPMFVPGNGDGTGNVKTEPNGQAVRGSTQNLSTQ
uniref:Neural proliferation differentiation and control protein 1 n=1 Tax=Trichuris muris TaxID=70415 RepID=A0A5S6QXP3_TRIMR